MNAKFNYQSYFLRTALALAGRKDEHKENRPSCALNRSFQTIRHLLLLLATAAAALCPGDAWADQISYIDESGTPRTADATQITSETTTIALSGNAAFYVSGNVTINGNLTITGPPYCFFLILCDGASLTVNGKIISNATFYTYCQSTGSSIGQLNVLSTADDAVTCYFPFFYGGKVTVAGGITSNNPGDIGRTQFTAGKLISVESYTFKAKSASDFICVGVYQIEYVHFSDDFITDDATPLTYEESDRIYDFSSLNGKKLTPKYIFNVTIDPGITGGTVTTDKTKIVENEPFTLTFTPDAGYMLFDVSYNNGYRHINSAELTTARSTGKWTITRYYRNKDCTVTATFAIPAATITSGGTTTYFASLASAYAAVADGETIVILRDDIDESSETYDFNNVTKNITIDMNGHAAKLCSFTSKYGSLTITDTSTGHNGKAEFVSIENCGDVTIENVAATFGTLSNPAANNDHTLTINGATVVCNGAAGDPPTTSIQWMADHIVLTGGADLTAKNLVFLGGGDGEFTFTIEDNASIAHLVNCKISGYDDTNKAHIVQLRQYVSPNDRNYYDTQTSADKAVTVDLRQAWGIELADGLGEISPGVPKAAVTFYDGGTSFDPTAFSPSAYTTSTLYVDNSDGKDHYVIAHIVPEFFYWTDLSLLSAVETGTSLTGDANALTLLKRDQYDAAISGDPDMRDRYDGAGWYYYTLPKGHSVAAGYTTSTLGGEVVPQFDLADENTAFSHDFDNNTLTISRTADTWKATLTYDKLSWKFGGSFALSDLPKLQSISFKKGDTEKFSQNDADALAGQIENAYEIEQVRIGDNPLMLRAIVNGCFVQSDCLRPKYKVLVPFDGAGSTGNPWQINTAADLSLLAKCVNVGGHTFESQNLKLTSATYDMSGSDFKPIGTFSNLPFKGNLNCNGATIRNITYAYDTPEGLAVTDETPIPTIGLVGYLVEGTVENARLENSSFSSISDSENCYVGSIAGIAKSGTVSNCYVIGGTVSAAKAGSYVGAIVGKLGEAPIDIIKNNYYDYTTTATLGSSTASGYVLRGTWMNVSSDGPATYSWVDFFTNDGAVLWVKRASFGTITKPTGSTSTIAFSQTTRGDNCYAVDGDDVLYAVNQPITLTVTEGQSTSDGLCTFYDGLSSLTVNGSSDGVDLTNRSFTMPEADATIAATFTSSDWFTMPSNGKAWMSFYHEWTDVNKTPVNYTVTAYGNTSNSRTRAVTNQLELLTIKKDGIDLDAGTATTLDLGGISFNGVPTLLHQEGGLPERLRFDPVAGQTAPQYDPQFVGGVSDLSPYTQKSVFMLFNSELVRADLSGDASGGSITADPHRAFVVVSDAPATSRLMLISDDATGVRSIDKSTTDDADGAWYGIDGRRLQGKPTKRGLYIVSGKKVVIK